MRNTKYERIADRHKAPEDRVKNSIIAFISGGFMGLFGEGIIEMFCTYFHMSRTEASTFMIVIFIFIATFLLILAETKGHFPSFKCGTESREYIDEQLAKGRKIPYHKIINWFGKIRGFEEFDREWCFWQLILCKTVRLIPVSFMLGSQFIFIGLCVAFVYNACFWVELKPFKKLITSPTNWGEFFQGCLYFQGLIKWETLI